MPPVLQTSSDSAPKWTVMVFMGADGVEGNVPLATEAQKDLDEMRQVGSGPTLSIFAQVHAGGDPERYRIGIKAKESDSASLIPSPIPPGERELANGTALASFVRWALAAAEHGPKDHSILVLWGHAYRFGIGHTETAAGIDAIDFKELASVLKRLQTGMQQHYGVADVPKLDIVGFDACDLSTIEMTIQLHQFADYLLASQIGIPLPGWPYDLILKRLRTPYGRIMGPAEFGSYVVRRFCEHYHAEKMLVSLTLLDLQRAPEVAVHTEVLALRLVTAVAEDRDERQLVYDLFRRSQTDEDRPFVDVADLCLNLARESSDAFVRDAAGALGDLLVSPPPEAPAGESARGARRPFVAEHGRNSAMSARLHGVSLYAPHVADAHEWEEASYWYKKFVFVQKTMWSGLVHALAQHE